MGEGPKRDTRDGPCRGSPLARLILDTSILVTLERAGGGLDDLIEDDDDVAIAAITVAELLVGVELAQGKRRARRRAHVDGILRSVSVDAYDLEVARYHAALLASVRRQGRPRGAHDLIIAATSAARSRLVVTTDASAFKDLPQVSVRTRTA